MEEHYSNFFAKKLGSTTRVLSSSAIIAVLASRSSLGHRSSRQRTIRSNQVATMRGLITALALMALGASAQDESIGTVIGIDLGKCCSTCFRSSATRSLRSPIPYRFRKPPLKLIVPPLQFVYFFISNKNTASVVVQKVPPTHVWECSKMDAWRLSRMTRVTALRHPTWRGTRLVSA